MREDKQIEIRVYKFKRSKPFCEQRWFHISGLSQSEIRTIGDKTSKKDEYALVPASTVDGNGLVIIQTSGSKLTDTQHAEIVASLAQQLAPDDETVNTVNNALMEAFKEAITAPSEEESTPVQESPPSSAPMPIPRR